MLKIVCSKDKYGSVAHKVEYINNKVKGVYYADF